MTIDKEGDARRQEAATWFARLGQKRVSTTDIHDFFEWRKDPANASAYERVERAWGTGRALAEDPDIAALTAEALGQAPPRVRARLMAARLWKPIAAGALALAALGLIAVWTLNRSHSYATSIGEQRTIRLADGSQVILDTDMDMQTLHALFLSCAGVSHATPASQSAAPAQQFSMG